MPGDGHGRSQESNRAYIVPGGRHGSPENPVTIMVRRVPLPARSFFPETPPQCPFDPVWVWETRYAGDLGRILSEIPGESCRISGKNLFFLCPPAYIHRTACSACGNAPE